MPLAAGERLGPYEILAPIGAGGMGEVYRARDPRMGRDVAIKVSAEQFNERFDREVRAVAALNHPNIAQIYDVGPNYLVMEFIEGEAPKGPYPLEEALRYAKQIAEALADAHEKNIVHHDLKPANIKIRPDGTVKVLDFGLAKVAEPESSSLSENSPTLTLGMTQAGAVLGTAAYMPPEQARGKRVDKRADIWGFGVVLFEMLTGNRLFRGETISDTLIEVATREPDWDQVPVEVRRLLQRCLAKDPRQRLRDIGDAWVLLEEPEVQPALAAVQPLRRSWLWPSIAAAAVLVAAGLAAIDWFRKPAEPAMVAFTVEPPPGKRLGLARVSPDGKRLAVAAIGSGNATQLLIRNLADVALRPIPGTDGTSNSFIWSPDSRKIAFVQSGQIKTIDLASGTVLSLCLYGASAKLAIEEPRDYNRLPDHTQDEIVKWMGATLP